MKSLVHVRNAIYSQPWAIRELMLDAIAEVVESKINGTNDPNAAINLQRKQKDPSDQIENRNGVDIIPVFDTISKRMNIFSYISGGTSIDVLTSQFQKSMANKDSIAVCLNFDSPGGSVSGIAELATAIYSARENSSKPIVASIDGMCASAAYWLASQCDAVYLTEASMAGNIGVIAKIDNRDRAEKNAGNDPVIIRSSELKGIGAGPITPSQHKALADTVATYYAMFKSAVARGRAGMIDDVDAISQAQDFIGAEAVKMGLCDAVMTLDSVIEMYGHQKPE